MYSNNSQIKLLVIFIVEIKDKRRFHERYSNIMILLCMITDDHLLIFNTFYRGSVNKNLLFEESFFCYFNFASNNNQIKLLAGSNITWLSL